MPNMDKTGPAGAGKMTGKRFGFCANVKGEPDLRAGRGQGYGCRRGFFKNSTLESVTQKEWLQEQKNFLHERLKVIDRQLESL